MENKRDKLRWLGNPQQTIFGYSILMVLILPLALFLFVPITLASGAALILTNIRWTIKAWWTKLRS